MNDISVFSLLAKLIDDEDQVEVLELISKKYYGEDLLKKLLVSSQPYNVVKYISYVPYIQLEGIEYEEIHRDAY